MAIPPRDQAPPRAVPVPEELLELARATAAEAARLVAGGQATAGVGADTKSSPVDVVTAVDRACEELVVRRLTTARPDDGVLGEEGASRTGSSPVRWVVDPIDGTTNFLYGLPCYAVCIAAQVVGGPDDGEVVAGVVHDVATGEVFTAARGRGAWLTRPGAAPQRLSGPVATGLDRALVGTGFGYASALRRREGAIVAELLPQVRDIRRLGSAALELCAVAAGRLDAFYELDLHPWDHAAAGLVVQEAGLVLAGLPGRPVGEPMVLAAGPGLIGPFTALLAELVERHP